MMTTKMDQMMEYFNENCETVEVKDDGTAVFAIDRKEALKVIKKIYTKPSEYFDDMLEYLISEFAEDNEAEVIWKEVK